MASTTKEKTKTMMRVVSVYGHSIALDIDVTNLTKYKDWEINDILDNDIKDKIKLEIQNNQKSGLIELSKNETKLTFSWHIVIDYMLLYRIYRWWYNCNIPINNIENFFNKTFETRLAAYYMDAFCHDNDYDVFKMIGTIGKREDDGLAFFHSVMAEVEIYEKKLK